MHCSFAPSCAYFYIFKDYFTPDGEYPTDDNWSTSLDQSYKNLLLTATDIHLLILSIYGIQTVIE